MQSTEQASARESAARAWSEAGRPRAGRAMEPRGGMRGRGAELAALAHDVRNMVTALGLYCDLLDEPGVLAPAFAHYAGELRQVATASRRLVERLASPQPARTDEGSALAAAGSNRGFEARENTGVAAGDDAGMGTAAGAARAARHRRRCDLLPAVPVTNLAVELMANRNLLAALAGPAVALTMAAAGGAQAVRLTGEDLTRLLVNLVKNASEAMPAGGRIHIGLEAGSRARGAAPCVQLTVEDNGPGIPEPCLERIFTAGYSTRTRETLAHGWPQSHRGLGLAIVRSIVEGAGGRIAAANRPQCGARLTLELPVRKAGSREPEAAARDQGKAEKRGPAGAREPGDRRLLAPRLHPALSGPKP